MTASSPSIPVAGVDDAVEVVRSALAERWTLELCGGGSKRGWGHPVAASRSVQLAPHSGVARYEPEELVLTVRPGTRLCELDELLGARGQTLGFEAPDFGPLWGGAVGEATIGGTVACNASGPRRLRAGAARDHLLGAEFVNGRGEIVRTGGRVVKNVTGYDLCKLLAGSFGTLGIMTELTLRVVPRPATSVSLALPAPEADVATRAMIDLMSGEAAPSALACLPAALEEPVQRDVGEGGLVLARFEGNYAGVAERARAAAQRFGGRLLDAEESAAAWTRIRDAVPFRGSGTLWRLAIPPAALGALAEILEEHAHRRWLADWGGSLVWVASEEPADAGNVRACAARVGGRATLFRSMATKSCPVWPPLEPALAALNARLRASFDPAGLFNPGRLGT